MPSVTSGSWEELLARGAGVVFRFLRLTLVAAFSHSLLSSPSSPQANSRAYKGVYWVERVGKYICQYTLGGCVRRSM